MTYLQLFGLSCAVTLIGWLVVRCAYRAEPQPPDEHTNFDTFDFKRAKELLCK